MIVDISKKNIKLIYTGKQKKLDLVTHNKIESYWRSCKSHNPFLFRGKIFCIEKIKINKSINIYLDESDYAYYLYCVNHKINELLYYKSRFCFVAALIETKDNKYVIGKMDQRTSSPLRFQLPGGGIEDKDIVGNEVNMIANIQHEILEELNINILYYINKSNQNPKYLVLGHYTMPIIFKFSVPLDSLYIRTRYDEIDNGEFSEVLFLEKKECAIDRFIQQDIFLADYLPIVLKTDVNL